MRLNEAVSMRVKEILRARNMTQYQLFLKSGVPQPTISALVRSLHPKQMLLTIYQICLGLNISLKDFFDSPLFQVENITEE